MIHIRKGCYFVEEESFSEFLVIITSLFDDCLILKTKLLFYFIGIDLVDPSVVLIELIG